MKVCISITVILLISLLVGSYGCSTTAPATYSISGTVNGAVQQGVTMTLSGDDTATATTDASGNFTFSELSNGDYTITPGKSGYTFSPANSAKTVDGSNLTGVNFTATALKYSISGTITLNSTGFQGVTMTLTGTSTATVTTDASGNYTFTDLINGNYTVTPGKTGYAFNPTSSAQTINGSNVASVNFAATVLTYSISGKVTHGSSNLFGVTMTLTGASTATVTTDTGGNYTFAGLLNGNYTITPSKSGYTFSPASSAQTVNGSNIASVNFVSTFSISGVVTVNSVGLQGVTMTLTGASSATVTTDTSGAYTFGGLIDGSYTITPGKSGYAFNPLSSAQTVSGSNISNINFAVTTYSISGKVTFGTIGLQGVTMTLTGASSATATTDTSGNYSFGSLVNGGYTIIPAKTGYTFSPASSAQTVNGSNVSNVNFTTASGTGYIISGTVYHQGGENSGSGVQFVTMTLNTSPATSVTTDQYGQYSINNIPNGNYTLTPSLSGSNVVFLPNNASVAINGANETRSFGANIIYTVSGTISYSGTGNQPLGKGRVYLDLIPHHEGNNLGTSVVLTSKGTAVPFTISGATYGTYTLTAWLDNSDPETGARNALSPMVTYGVDIYNDIVNDNIVIFDPSPLPASSAPTNVSVFPGNGTILIQWQAPEDSNGRVLAQSYNIYYSTTSPVNIATATKKSVQATTDTQGHIIISGLTDGSTYYFVVTSVLGSGVGSESSPSTEVSAIVGATTGSNTVTGNVTFPGTATGPLYAIVYGIESNGVYFQRIAAPVSPQSYSISGVPSGTYMALALIDMNNDGIIGIGDLSNTSNINMNIITVNGNVAGVDQTLSNTNILLRVSTAHIASDDFTMYSVRFEAAGNMKLPVKLSLISGLNTPVPIDLSINNFDAYFDTGSVRPTVGDRYVFSVLYSDGTAENVAVLITAVLDSDAQNLTVSGDPNIPTFNWAAPASPPPSYSYQIYVGLASGGMIWYYPQMSLMPSTQTSVVFNVDGMAYESTLTTGIEYQWGIVVRDSNGNQVMYFTSYTP